MKKINSGVWFFLWALITIILVLLSAKYMNRSLFQTKPAGPIASSSSLNGLTLNMAEIAKHNSASDCWLLINNKVYDVTAAISSHPGGAGPILAHCGQEATQAFNTKDIGRPHSANATAMLAAYYIGDFSQTLGQAPTPAVSSSSVSVNNIPLIKPVVSVPVGQVTLNMAEIAKHNSATDCWLLINNKVYNVTSAISSHPGGAGPILAHCGQEATQAFNTKDIGRPHSANAMSQLAAYFIGNFNQTIGQAQIQQNIQQTNTVVPTTRGGEDDGGDS